MKPDRNTAVDLVRAAALIGIAVVNIPFMALPAEAVLTLPASGPDRLAAMAVQLLFQAKFFLLFSFVFGWGMEIQTRAAERAGASFRRRFARRLAALALLGILHAVLVFAGDILLLYALLGLLAWVAKGASARNLLRMAAVLVPVAALCLALLAAALPDVPPPPPGPTLGGTYIETVLARWRDWPQTFLFLLLFQGHLALAAFLAGIAAARSGFFEPGSAAAERLKRAVPLLLATGLALNGFHVLGALAPSPLLALTAFASLALGGPVLAAAWLGLVLRAADRLRPPEFLLLAGRNSLTAYVLQGVLAGLIVGGYGLGLHGGLGQMTLLPLSVGVALLSMAIVATLARSFGQGPLELALRHLTRG